MQPDCYLCPSNKGDVVICRNEEHQSRWDLRIDGQLICPGYYTSPEQAALQAHKRDFGDKELNEMYVGLRVPDDLGKWEQRKLSKKELSLL
jgi:hypothetical protein